MPLPFRLAAFYFAFFLCAGLQMAYFPPYLAGRGFGPGEIAWVLALPHFARIVAPTAWGWLADRTGGHRGIVLFSCAANVACFASLPWVDGLGPVGWLMGATSLLSAAALPLVEGITLGALASQPGRYGPIRLWGSVGFIAGVLGGGTWLEFRPVWALPYALLAFSVLTLASAWLLPAQAAPRGSSPREFRVSPAALLVIAASFCMTVAHGALYAFFTLYLQAEGYSGAAIGLLWTLGVVAEIAVFFYLPALFRRFTLRALLMGSFAIAVLRFLAIGWGAGHVAVLLAAQLAHAATFGSFHAAAVAAVQRSFPEHARARGQTLFSSFAYGAGGACGALLAGWMWTEGGAGLAFSASALVALLGWAAAWRLKRHGL